MIKKQAFDTIWEKYTRSRANKLYETGNNSDQSLMKEYMFLDKAKFIVEEFLEYIGEIEE